MILAYVLSAQKNRLIETVLLSTHNKCFGWEIKKSVFFCYAHLTKCLPIPEQLYCPSSETMTSLFALNSDKSDLASTIIH